MHNVHKSSFPYVNQEVTSKKKRAGGVPGRAQACTKTKQSCKFSKINYLRGRKMSHKLVYGVGHNDVEGEVKSCVYYNCWKVMLRDCYYTTVQGINGSVCESWLIFSIFREWLWTNGAAGLLAISPDVLTTEMDAGKAAFYSPQTSRMVSRAIKNHLRKYQRDYALGFKSMISERGNRYVIKASSLGRYYYLGCVSTKKTAVKLCRAHKADVLEMLIDSNGSKLLSKQTIHELKQQAKVIRG